MTSAWRRCKPCPRPCEGLKHNLGTCSKNSGLVAGQLAGLLLPTFRHLCGPEAVFFPSSSNSCFTTAEAASSLTALFPVELQ